MTFTGVGTCVIDANQAGNADYNAAAQQQQSFTVTPASTTTTVGCQPSGVVAGQSTTCTATVTETGSGAQSTPSGTVGFSTSGPGGFTGSLCRLSGSGPSASCQVSYTPGATTSDPVRSDTITGTYNGDSSHDTSSGTTKETVISPTALSRGAFVIGDQNATVGNSVTFWGAQWSGLNSLSGGSAPASFKGFASQTPTTRPDAGIAGPASRATAQTRLAACRSTWR